MKGQLVKNFSPAWFAVVMGTGGLANVLFVMGKSSPLAGKTAVGLWLLNCLLFLVLLIPWVARWFSYPQETLADLKHPQLSNFFVTMPAGALIVASNFLVIGKPYFTGSFLVTLGLVLWIIGAVLSFVFAVIGIYNQAVGEMASPDPINFSWLMMPVVNILLPLTGNMLVKSYWPVRPDWAKLINIIDIGFFGIGLLLFLLMAAVVLNRLIINKMPPAMATPTFWVLLGPIGVGTVSLMGLADVAQLLGLVTDVSPIKFMALVLWGFGLWVFIFILAITVRYMRSGGIPFSLSWWAFIFPLAAYTLSSFNVFQYTRIPILRGYALLMAFLLIVLWVITFVKTLMGSVKGQLFAPPPSPKKA